MRPLLERQLLPLGTCSNVELNQHQPAVCEMISRSELFARGELLNPM